MRTPDREEDGLDGSDASGESGVLTTATATTLLLLVLMGGAGTSSSGVVVVDDDNVEGGARKWAQQWAISIAHI
eukprot:scaffold154672_cov38-Attheya_sp.AAC.2